jgi:hypothetical protein
MTDWYVTKWKLRPTNQLHYQFLTHDQYVGDKLDYVVHIPKIDRGVKRFNEFYQNPKSTVQMQNGQTIYYLQIKLKFQTRIQSLVIK